MVKANVGFRYIWVEGDGESTGPRFKTGTVINANLSMQEAYCSTATYLHIFILLYKG